MKVVVEPCPWALRVAFRIRRKSLRNGVPKAQLNVAVAVKGMLHLTTCRKPLFKIIAGTIFFLTLGQSANLVVKQMVCPMLRVCLVMASQIKSCWFSVSIEWSWECPDQTSGLNVSMINLANANEGECVVFHGHFTGSHSVCPLFSRSFVFPNMFISNHMCNSMCGSYSKNRSEMVCIEKGTSRALLKTKLYKLDSIKGPGKLDRGISRVTCPLAPAHSLAGPVCFHIKSTCEVTVVLCLPWCSLLSSLASFGAHPQGSSLHQHAGLETLFRLQAWVTSVCCLKCSGRRMHTRCMFPITTNGLRTWKPWFMAPWFIARGRSENFGDRAVPRDTSLCSGQRQGGGAHWDQNWHRNVKTGKAYWVLGWWNGWEGSGQWSWPAPWQENENLPWFERRLANGLSGC